MGSEIKLTERQRIILSAVGLEPCLPLTLTDVLDDDVSALRHAGLVKTYWAIGGTHWCINDAGRAALARSTQDDGEAGR